MVVMPFVFWLLLSIYCEFQLCAMLYRICLRDTDFDPAEQIFNLFIYNFCCFMIIAFPGCVHSLHTVHRW